jgi:signal transduction histidine kinase
VVDDKPENLVAMQALFKGSGYNLVEADSGKEALKQAAFYDFACIILDVQMPGMDGYETAKALRLFPRTQNTPIIFATALNPSLEYEQLGYGAGAVDFLFKPINPTILKAKVSVFVDLFLQAEEIKIKNALLEEAIEKSRENTRLKEALAARDEFLMMASHELKTPITPLHLQIQTFIQLLEADTLDKMDKTRLMRMLQTSKGQIERLSRLVTELIDVSRLSIGKIQLNVLPATLKSITDKVLIDFHEEIKRSGCALTFRARDEAPGTWDSFRIEQIIINLLTNALKYGAGRPVDIEVFSVNDHAYFTIRDHGIGVAAEDHQRIFQRFERAVSGNNYSGLGLGLYISSEMVKLHKGSIKVESQMGQGAFFSMELPQFLRISPE